MVVRITFIICLCFSWLTLFGGEMFGMFAFFPIFAILELYLFPHCHSDDQREEESRGYGAAENVDATEILHFTTLRSE